MGLCETIITVQGHVMLFTTFRNISGFILTCLGDLFSGTCFSHMDDVIEKQRTCLYFCVLYVIHIPPPMAIRVKENTSKPQNSEYT